MAVREIDTPSRLARPPRAMAWVLLLASAGAVLLVGLFATALVFGNLGARPTPPWPFWVRLAGACALTIASLSLRSLRWIFLLRRAETRIPIRDAYIGYFAGLSLLFTPLFLGEIAIRALINRTRGRVPLLATAVVNLWERGLDLAALALIAVIAAWMTGQASAWGYVVLAGIAAMFVPAVRMLALRALVAGVERLTRTLQPTPPFLFDWLAGSEAWLTSLAASVVAWVLPGIGFWWLAGTWGQPFSLTEAQYAYVTSTSASGLLLAPGGVLVTGERMLASLTAHGFADAAAVLIVLGTRLATVGVSIALGAVFVFLHFRSAAARSETHFDDISAAYDVQIPESRRHALLDRKTTLMRELIAAQHVGSRGLDVGCGQGAYVGRMRSLGFDVTGIDASAGQVRLAGRNVGEPGCIQLGSALDIPAPDETFDFVYIINVLHHLESVDEQRRAFVELTRVLKPGGLLFVHEINTRNILFRFYMGYVFPSLNCIDEGIERWLLPHNMAHYTDTPVVDTRYFTFLPDFIPEPLARLFAPVERTLERSSLRHLSAHYMVVLSKAHRTT